MKRNRLIATIAGAACCGAVSTVASAQTLQFDPVKVPVSDQEKREILASSSVRIAGGKEHDIGFNTIARSGDKIGDTVLGLLLDKNGNPVKNTDGSEHISVDNDFSSLIQRDGKLFSVMHFESRPGAMYLTELKQEDDGTLKPVSTESIDFSAVGGLWVPCAGSVTPWGTHLGSEEYPPDARMVEEAKSLADVDDYYKPMARYFGVDAMAPDASIEAFRAVFNPYAYGYPTEIDVDAAGTAAVHKHYGMGRVAVELAYVMPDKKTAYISDDGTNVGLFMFVADTEGDLSAGTLYAAKWIQKDTRAGGAADLEWINLGQASDAEMAEIVNKGTKFSEIFETADGDKETGACPDGFTSVNTTTGFECLKVRPGMEKAASRLETRRYAAMKGATTEFRKMEGITFDPSRSTMYLAISEVARGMEDNRKNAEPTTKYDIGGGNHIRLPYDECGVVYGMDAGLDPQIGSEYVAKTMRGEVMGHMTQYAKDSDYVGNTCLVEGIANPDNLTFVTGYDTLIIGEDTGSGHQNDAIWAYDVNTNQLTRILTTPYGSETTSPYWYPDVNGHGYLMSVVQHPYGESDEDKLKDPSEAMGYVGYIGPFPNME